MRDSSVVERESKDPFSYMEKRISHFLTKQIDTAAKIGYANTNERRENNGL